MILFDSHCHLDDAVFEADLEAVLERMEAVGVKAAMVVGVDQASSAKAVRLALAHAPLYAAVGFHPHDAKACDEQALAALVELAACEKVKAWGEIGLDFNRMFSPRQVQEQWLVRQLEAAGQLGLPVIFHERDSNGRLIEILKAHPLPDGRGVVHCFSGNRNELRHYLDMGLAIGITGILTHKTRGTQLRELARTIPADRILIETDAPYLTPSPQRNAHRRNEPAFVATVLAKLAAVRNEDPVALAEVIWTNTCRVFGIADL